MGSIPLSILDLSPVLEGHDAAHSYRESVETAQLAERLGYKRYWFAEHHNIASVASSATSILIGHIAGATKTIRVGAGGIMLPNHAPLMIAEQFGTLESLYPGRIDLGLGRAAGGGQATARALRRTMMGGEDRFPNDVQELLMYFSGEGRESRVNAVPGEGLGVPIWILGSSLYGAQLAAHFGLPYAFASHFAPAALVDAARIYRETFRPSDYLDKPHFMMASQVVAADTDEEADFQASTVRRRFQHMQMNVMGLFSPPDPDFEFDPRVRRGVEATLAMSVVGSPQTVKARLDEMMQALQPDELIISAPIYDLDKRKRSMEIVMEVAG